MHCMPQIEKEIKRPGKASFWNAEKLATMKLDI